MNLWQKAALFAFLAILITLSFLKRKTTDSRKIYFFRALFPSWQFFDRTGVTPQLWLRTGTTPQSLGEWKPALVPLRRTPINFWWQTLLLNPSGNFQFACDSLLHQWIEDAPDRRTNLPSYDLIRALAHSLTPSHCYLQFQIQIPALPGEASAPEIFFQSPVEKRDATCFS